MWMWSLPREKCRWSSLICSAPMNWSHALLLLVMQIFGGSIFSRPSVFLEWWIMRWGLWMHSAAPTVKFVPHLTKLLHKFRWSMAPLLVHIKRHTIKIIVRLAENKNYWSCLTYSYAWVVLHTFALCVYSSIVGKYRRKQHRWLIESMVSSSSQTQWARIYRMYCSKICNQCTSCILVIEFW